MLKDDGLYALLLRMAMDGMIDGLARSVLRHIPKVGMPGPARSISSPFGFDNLSQEERAKVMDDDLLMFKMWLVYEVAQMARDPAVEVGDKKKSNRKGPVKFMLEPADPTTEPDCATIWRTVAWRKFRDLHGLDEISFDQEDMGGLGRKPTTCGTNMQLEVPPVVVGPKKGRARDVISSKDLARWAPGMMRMVAQSIVKEAQEKEVVVRRLSWTEHVQQGHMYLL